MTFFLFHILLRSLQNNAIWSLLNLVTFLIKFHPTARTSWKFWKYFIGKWRNRDQSQQPKVSIIHSFKVIFCLLQFYFYQILMAIVPQTINCLLRNQIVKILKLLFLYFLHLICWQVYLRLNFFFFFFEYFAGFGKEILCTVSGRFLDRSRKCSVQKISYCSFPYNNSLICF